MRYVPLQQRPGRKDRGEPFRDIGPESLIIARKYLTSLNTALCAFLSLVFWTMSGSRDQDQPWPVLYLVPGGAFLPFFFFFRRIPIPNPMCRQALLLRKALVTYTPGYLYSGTGHRGDGSKNHAGC